MFHTFFNAENPIFRFTSRVLDILVLSTMWVVCSLPVVTIGPASAALYYSCAKCLRYKEPHPYGSFWSSFRQNLMPGAIATAGFLLLALALAAVYAFLESMMIPDVFRVMYLVLMLVPMSVVTCAFPLLSRFSYTAGALLSNSVRLTLAHLPRLLAAAVVNTACIVIVIKGWYYNLVLLVPALDALVLSYLLEPVFRKYTPGAASAGEEEDDPEAKPWYLR